MSHKGVREIEGGFLFDHGVWSYCNTKVRLRLSKCYVRVTISLC